MVVMKAKNWSLDGTYTFVWYFTSASYDLLDKCFDLLNASQYFVTFLMLFQIYRALSVTGKSSTHLVNKI